MTLDNTTSAVAVCSLFSDLWLHTLSDGAQLVLPFLAATWLIVQITAKVAPWIISLIKSRKTD